MCACGGRGKGLVSGFSYDVQYVDPQMVTDDKLFNIAITESEAKSQHIVRRYDTVHIVYIHNHDIVYVFWICNNTPRRRNIPLVDSA